MKKGSGRLRRARHNPASQSEQLLSVIFENRVFLAPEMSGRGWKLLSGHRDARLVSAPLHSRCPQIKWKVLDACR